MKALLLRLIILLSFTCISAQNLVKNASFENYRYCPDDISRFDKNVDHWTVLLGTTDYMNACSRTVGFQNHNGKQTARSGKGYAGLYVFSKNDYREYIGGTLSEKLVKDKKYVLTFYVSLADYATLAIKDFSVLFTNSKLGYKDFTSNRNHTLVTPKSVSKINGILYNFYDQPEPIFYKSKQIWMQVYIPFTAKGYETHFIIGSFVSNTRTKKLRLTTDTKQKQFSYYYVDDVSVELKDSNLKINAEESLPKEVRAVPTLEQNKVYSFRNVLFEFDKAVLLAESQIELNALSEFLLQNNKLRIEIYGHTDAVGTKAHNLELSKARAKAVTDYLALKIQDKNRIKWFGYGSTKPIANNTTENGRTKNRRVEFKLIED
ncbi:OmpA family protein [Cellulophaga sp. F20128]|uniref:OmpA family protein n=1 Tax=Cellulophaga sp. F20128 TaxID=2926413 RepID=UPI001FF507FC|nr:OmpA family protein [Cellulophaga sp. F20128]MCK0158785.1 OmpA family protein [Cellulophaga sp. F20128]